MTIGNSHDAALAAFGVLPKIGEGCDRTVYRSGDIVYKVETEEWWPANLLEAEAIAHFKSLNLPDVIGIPDCELHDDVLAMPFIDGQLTGECSCIKREECDETCLPADIYMILSNAGHRDMGYGNIIFRDGIYWLVDLAFYLR